MSEKIVVTKAPRKVVRWHEGLVIFLTKECKKLGWDDSVIIRAYIDKSGKSDKIVIEKVGKM